MQIAGATLDIWPTQFGFLFGPGQWTWPRQVQNVALLKPIFA